MSCSTRHHVYRRKNNHILAFFKMSTSNENCPSPTPKPARSVALADLTDDDSEDEAVNEEQLKPYRSAMTGTMGFMH